MQYSLCVGHKPLGEEPILLAKLARTTVGNEWLVCRIGQLGFLEKSEYFLYDRREHMKGSNLFTDSMQQNSSQSCT